VAAINGPCAGGALALACATDLRFAARTASLTTAFANVGQPADMGLPWTLTHLVGSARATELMLVSDVINGDEAARLGLVHRSFDDVSFADDVEVVVRKLASLAPLAPLAVQAMKQNLLASQRLSFPDYLGAEISRYVSNSHTKDSLEAAQAFLERRPRCSRAAESEHP
jgi:2-(1,2-epoxy-1,2-dihydrophenyl)acetyl-CoA isomerase